MPSKYKPLELEEKPVAPKGWRTLQATLQAWGYEATSRHSVIRMIAAEDVKAVYVTQVGGHGRAIYVEPVDNPRGKPGEWKPSAETVGRKPKGNDPRPGPATRKKAD